MAWSRGDENDSGFGTRTIVIILCERKTHAFENGIIALSLERIVIMHGEPIENDAKRKLLEVAEGLSPQS